MSIQPTDPSKQREMESFFLSESEQDDTFTDESDVMELIAVAPKSRILEDGDEDDTPDESVTMEDAADFLTRFFEGKRWHCGGPIPKAVLLCDRHLQMVLRLEMNDCVDLFYEALGVPKRFTRKETKLLSSLLDEAYQKSIPKHHTGGLVLVYLRLCIGLDI